MSALTPEDHVIVLFGPPATSRAASSCRASTGSRRPRAENVLRGQYVGYRDEPGVAHDSQTEAFVAARVAIENWRWAGVPFYLRTGKRMAQSRRVLTITFHDPPRRMFECGDDVAPNQVVFDLGDRGGYPRASWRRCPARRCAWGGRASASTTRTRSRPSTSSRPTSA
jgi:Glucose-6-phosphate dehydrogenase, C-terminal domain